MRTASLPCGGMRHDSALLSGLPQLLCSAVRIMCHLRIPDYQNADKRLQLENDDEQDPDALSNRGTSDAHAMRLAATSDGGGYTSDLADIEG